MRYISLDIETTGLDPERDQVLQVAMVAEDTDNLEIAVEELPSFTCLVKHERYEGGAFALAMNHELLEMLAGKGKREASAQIFDGDRDLRQPAEWEDQAMAWLRKRERPLVAAGKNVSGFDLRFFHPDLRGMFHHRTVDPGSVFIDFSQEAPMGLEAIKKRLGIPGGVAHDALEDARDVVRVLRRFGRFPC